MSDAAIPQPHLLPDSSRPTLPIAPELAQRPEPLNRFDRLGLLVLVVVFIVFGGIVQTRSAFLPRRLGDWNVFARAAWAARSGGDLYDITDDNGFHYLYPPTFAILLAPLADAPDGSPRDGLLPYPVTVLYWYCFNLVCLAVSAHWLATSLEAELAKRAGGSLTRCRRWWGMRLWPVLACLPPVGHTLMRGQVGVLLLLFLSGMISAVVARKRGQAGAWLACAICLKVIPALLLVYPVVRRDVKMLGGCAAGLLLGLAIIPVAARGPRQTWDDYRKWNQVMLAPAIAGGSDTSRSQEVLDVISTDSQSFLAMIHNTVFLDRTTRPRQAAEATKFAALSLSLMSLLALFAVSRGCRDDDTIATVIQLGAVIEIMLLASPVCHLHYFCLSIPLVAGLFAAAWQHAALPRLGIGLSVLVGVNVAANTIPHFPGMEVWRDIGIAGHAALLFVGAALAVLWRRRRTDLKVATVPLAPMKAAA
jgi:alpha-1,2-mannosyltransferase